MDNIAVYRLRETQPLLVLALHEADKHLQTAIDAKDRQFYNEYIQRLKVAIGANTDAVIVSEEAAMVRRDEPDLQFECLPEAALITPLGLKAFGWLLNTLPALYGVELGKPCRMSRELAVSIVERAAGCGLTVRAA